MSGIYLYFVNKHLSGWPLLGLYGNSWQTQNAHLPNLQFTIHLQNYHLQTFSTNFYAQVSLNTNHKYRLYHVRGKKKNQTRKMTKKGKQKKVY